MTSYIQDSRGTTVAQNTSHSVNIAAGSNDTMIQVLTVGSPLLWSPETPSLYTIRCRLMKGNALADSFTTTFGIRTFSFDANKGFFLNGKSLKINGVNLNHNLGCLGAAVNYRAIERQVEILKAMGCNAIRTAHNPPAPELLDICDRKGMIVMVEAFDCWSIAKVEYDYHRLFYQWAQKDIQDMVIRDRNHPSVFIWSIGNENLDLYNPVGIPNARRLADWVRAVDKSRPVTVASNNLGEVTQTVFSQVVDIAGYNYNTEGYDSDHRSYPSRIIIATETSAALSSRGVYYRPADRQIDCSSTDLQCSSYDNSWPYWGCSAEYILTTIAARPFIVGQFYWSGFDYIGEPFPFSYPARSSYFGLVDLAGFPKDSYYLFQSQWIDSPMVHILPHWNWPVGDVVPVFVYSNCPTVELFLNNRSLGAKNASAGAIKRVWNVPFEAGVLRAEAKNGSTVVATDTVRTAGNAKRIVLKPDRHLIVADGYDLSFVTVLITDSNGVVVPKANNTVSFTVSGVGTLVGVDNGDPTSLMSFKDDSMKVFNGKCLAVVRSINSVGTINVEASSSGLISGSTTIQAGNQTQIMREEQQTIRVFSPDVKIMSHENPYNSFVKIAYFLPKEEEVILRIFSSRGMLVKTLVYGKLPHGYHVAEWNGTDSEGRLLPSGMYLIDFRCGSGQISKRAHLIR